MARTDDPTPTIARMRARGMPDSVIMNRLLIEGYPEESFRALFNAVPAAAVDLHALPIKVAQEEPVEPLFARGHTKRALKRNMLLAALMGACALLGAIAYMYIRPPAVYSISIPEMATSTPALQYGALPALSDPDYYQRVKNGLIEQRASFIDANLSSMRLTVYTNGSSTLEVPILAKGKIGSWWETPAGIYKIQTKESNHLSSMGDVYMPYSMEFQGNFFIHGWPYYPGGKPVATTFSGGCIRLSTDDAKDVYALAEVGLPVIVYNEAPQKDAFAYQLKAPAISAKSYLVADLSNDTVLTSFSASSTAPIASITKLVTALVATEYINLDKMLFVPPEAIVYTSVSRLRSGSSARAYDLLFLLLQESSNEAAETLARSYGRNQFVTAMNDKAHAIGLAHTLFYDPSGAKNDLSTAEDLFTLLKYIYANRRFVFSITTGHLTDSAYGTPAFKNIGNFNYVPGAPAQLIGGKIGETRQAGETYAGVFDVEIGGLHRNIAVIVLGSDNATRDVAKLLTFVHNQYAPANGPLDVEEPLLDFAPSQ